MTFYGVQWKDKREGHRFYAVKGWGGVRTGESMTGEIALPLSPEGARGGWSGTWWWGRQLREEHGESSGLVCWEPPRSAVCVVHAVPWPWRQMQQRLCRAGWVAELRSVDLKQRWGESGSTRRLQGVVLGRETEQWFSQCGPQATGISTAWGRIRNADSQIWPWVSSIRLCRWALPF